MHADRHIVNQLFPENKYCDCEIDCENPLEDVYTKIHSSQYKSCRLSEEFETVVEGVQGCVLSPLLYLTSSLN